LHCAIRSSSQEGCSSESPKYVGLILIVFLFHFLFINLSIQIFNISFNKVK
jgi:hypothetical protein